MYISLVAFSEPRISRATSRPRAYTSCGTEFYVGKNHSPCIHRIPTTEITDMHKHKSNNSSNWSLNAVSAFHPYHTFASQISICHTSIQLSLYYGGPFRACTFLLKTLCVLLLLGCEILIYFPIQCNGRTKPKLYCVYNRHCFICWWFPVWFPWLAVCDVSVWRNIYVKCWLTVTCFCFVTCVVFSAWDSVERGLWQSSGSVEHWRGDVHSTMWVPTLLRWRQRHEQVCMTKQQTPIYTRHRLINNH